MIGKLIGGTLVAILTLIGYIPFIGQPLVRTIIFVLENLGRLIMNLPYIIGFTVVGVFVAIWLGII